jgi:hypothetical protein
VLLLLLLLQRAAVLFRICFWSRTWMFCQHVSEKVSRFCCVQGGALIIFAPNNTHDLGGGYKKMCYFYTHFLPNWLHEHNFDFYLRLDDDVFLEDSPNPLDVVAWMQEQSLDYVYGRRKIDSHGETQRSLTAFCADWFAKRNMVAPENIAYNYYNNFSVGRVAFWFRPSVQEFLRDTREGIKRFRWGDSTLQAVALRAFGGERSVIPVMYTHGSHGYRSFSRSGDYLPQHQWDE